MEHFPSSDCALARERIQHAETDHQRAMIAESFENCLRFMYLLSGSDRMMRCAASGFNPWWIPFV